MKVLSCQSRADESEGFVGSKPCGRSEQERRLCRVKAVRTSGQERRLCRVKAVQTIRREQRLCRVKAVRTSGQERRLCRVKAVQTRAKALSGQSRADERTGQKSISTGHY